MSFEIFSLSLAEGLESIFEGGVLSHWHQSFFIENVKSPFWIL